MVGTNVWERVARQSSHSVAADLSMEGLQIGQGSNCRRGPDDVEGQADAGEEVDEIVQVLEREDREAMVEEEILADAPDEDGDEDEDEDDDDDVQGNHPIPEEWNRDDLATMEAMDMQRSRFQSGCTMIQVKQAFRNKN